MKKIIVLLLLMVSSFLISGLFFLNSGIIDHGSDELDEVRTTKILYELDTIPFIYIDVDTIIFATRGILTTVGNETFFLSSDKGDQLFTYSINTSHFEEGDRVKVYYSYSSEGDRKVTEIVKKS